MSEVELSRISHPIVDVLRAEGRSQRWLARTIRRSPEHVNRVLQGSSRAAPAFRAACAAALGRDERDLFHDGGASSAGLPPPTEGGALNRAGSAVTALYSAESTASRRSA